LDPPLQNLGPLQLLFAHSLSELHGWLSRFLHCVPTQTFGPVHLGSSFSQLELPSARQTICPVKQPRLGLLLHDAPEVQLGTQFPVRQVPVPPLHDPPVVGTQRFIDGLQVSHWPLQESQHSLVVLHC
jgi:hypothetical protein